MKGGAVNPLFQSVVQKLVEEVFKLLNRKYFDPWIKRQFRTTQIWVYTLFLIFMVWFGWWSFDNETPHWIVPVVCCPIVIFLHIALIFNPDWLERRKMEIAIAEKERNSPPEICPTCRTIFDKGEYGDCKFCKLLKNK